MELFDGSVYNKYVMVTSSSEPLRLLTTLNYYWQANVPDPAT
jgi:hypothetical protein